MPSKTSKKINDRGRNFYETSSPFETFEPGGGAPKTFRGLTDETPMPRKLSECLTGEEVFGKMQPEQYDNPRGFPGMAMITVGSEKSKLPLTSKHSILHHAEGEGALARTGKR